MITLLAILLYFFSVLILGYLVRRYWRITDIDDYFTAKRHLRTVLSFFTYFSTTYSAFMLIGLVGWSYFYGVGTLGFELMYLIGTVALLSTVGVKIFQIGKTYNLISPTQLIYELRDVKIARYVIPITYMIFLIPYMSIQLIGPALILSRYGVPYSYGVLVMAIVVLIYILVSGFRGVAFTDTLQGMLFLTTATVLTSILVGNIGQVQNTHPKLFTVPGGYDFWTFEKFVLLIVPWMFFALSNPQVLQRVYTTYDYVSYRRMVILFSIAGLVYTVLMVLIGLSARALISPEMLPKLDVNLVTPTLLTIIPEVLAALVVVSILAAAKSTLDSILLTLSSCIFTDFLKKRGSLFIAKLIVIMITIAIIYFALTRYGPIVKLAVESAAALMYVVPSILFSIYGKVRGVYIDVAIILGIIVYVVLKSISIFVIKMFFTIPGILAAITSLIVLLIGWYKSRVIS